MEKKPNANGMILDVEEMPTKKRQWVLFPLQHILAMLVACITVPLLTGLPVGATLVAAGIGTLIYIFVTGKKSPVFLSSSFAYLSPMFSALLLGVSTNVIEGYTTDAGVNIAQLSKDGKANYLVIILGMLVVGAIYVAIALIIKKTGTSWLNRLLPPVVIGPIIMVIGLSLAGSAVKNVVSGGLTNQATTASNYVYVLCGFVAAFVTAICAHYGKKTVSLIPFVLGMGIAYVFASVLTGFGYALNQDWLKVVDYSALTNLDFTSISGYITTDWMFIRAAKQTPTMDLATFGSIIVIFAPVALVTICEHIGDHENLGNILGRDLLNGEPGLTRTLIGDGIATAVSGGCCGAANTTYGENVAVIGVSRIASTAVVIVAAIATIAFGLLAPIAAFLSTVPACITGGVSLILYGFIASSGVKMLIKEKVDFGVTRNIIIASVILVVGIGGMQFNIGKAAFTSTALAMILGIIFNLILVEKKEKKFFEDTEEKNVQETETTEK